MNGIKSISSISQIHQLLGYDAPSHPLITLLEPDNTHAPQPEIKHPIVTELYTISLKNGHECSLKYGRRTYDFQEGSLLFLAPGQSIVPIQDPVEQSLPAFFGWTLVFHPDLIRRSSLQKNIPNYSYFNYDSSEALHISEQERTILTELVLSIKKEYSSNLDEFSHTLILSQIELLLNYCKRYYGRQFITRSNENLDIIARFDSYLKAYFDSDQARSSGLLTVKTCAREVGYSTNYLSDLLKKETGKNAQEHIYFYLIEKAKDLLLSSQDPVNCIASSLGFEYSQHFSKLFKNKVGLSPSEYRIHNQEYLHG